MADKFALDKYAHKDSLIHSWHPKYKIIGISLLIFSFAFIQDISLIPVMLGITFIFYYISKLPLSFLVSRLRYPGFFLLGMIILLQFMRGENIIWQWSFLKLRQEGTLLVLVIVSRFFSIFTMGLVMFGTAPFMTTIQSMKQLGLSRVIADMLILSYRYIYQIFVDFSQMQQAMRVRGYTTKKQSNRKYNISLFRHISVLAAVTASLLLQSYEQSERVYAAMRLRGYGDLTTSIIKPNTIDDKQTKNTSLSLLGLFGTAIIAVSLFLWEVI